ncbi:hypothetical protein TNCT_516291 [Trichonephila clavata]|uniref:Uncharacterized protein n=1 Tax=Trichonephila clavata TaxID=2740835 RepID=A0A8X6GNL8_TRICU|nr:hypothetical protein TNCT_516291 [Trichonephila clavata]
MVYQPLFRVYGGWGRLCSLLFRQEEISLRTEDFAEAEKEAGRNGTTSSRRRFCLIKLRDIVCGGKGKRDVVAHRGYSVINCCVNKTSHLNSPR